MTLSDLNKYRKYIPFALFSLCILPWFAVRSKTTADVKAACDVIIPALAFIAAFVYVGGDLGKARWKAEKEAYVGKQIREKLLAMIPADLAVTRDEARALEGEVFKELSGVFWEAIEGSEILKSQKEHFYSNGIVYSTSIDVFVICSFSGFVYAVIAVISKNVVFAYVAFGLVALALISKWFVTPVKRARHLALSQEQLELLERERGDFVSTRFREIVTNWRKERFAMGR
jgi:hypothetical protein